jgi:cellulose synthase/poly-beta-1,6-N-acetylglucosamine synthase-like glycosyltransferase
LATNYPTEKLQIFIGSDNSNDATNKIVEELSANHSNLFFKNFTKRQGKPSIINQLNRWATEVNPAQSNHIYIITDANVIFSKALIFELVKHFKNEKLALVDSNIVNLGMKKEGISYTESSYIKGEIQMKHREGVIWQQTLGPLGGCFSLRSTYYSDVPSKYLVDDFYLAMSVFEQGGKAINEPKAICYEDVSHSIKEEFRRKTRIATGNFQNLKRFKNLWLVFPPNSLSFIFISHKVLRWLGPLLIIGTWLSSGILAYSGNLLFQLLFILESAFLLAVPLLYFAMQSLGIQSSILRTITYFNVANLAMLRGLFKYLKGVKTNVWQPTKRHTTEIRHD